MKALFVSGDVGGARALIPVMEACERHSFPFAVCRHGHIATEAPQRWEWVRPNCTADMRNFFEENGVGLLVFATSSKDTTALTLARRAGECLLPTIHVLDNWTSYALRLKMDGLPAFVPDAYTVMDDRALREAEEDGVDGSLLHVTGQPALASLWEEYRLWHNSAAKKGSDGDSPRPGKSVMAFVSEPVTHDQGATAASPVYRGYTETEVLSLFCQTMQPYADRVKITVLPHPREDREELSRHWESARGLLEGGIVSVERGRNAIFGADAVVGMASLLLYEAWLLGKPVMSLQPGLRVRPLRMLESRRDVLFIDRRENMDDRVKKWVSSIRPGARQTPLPELGLHEKAPENVFRLIERYAKQKKADRKRRQS